MNLKTVDIMTPREDLVTLELPGTRAEAVEYFKELEFASLPAVVDANGTEEFRGLVKRTTLISKPDEERLNHLVEEVPAASKDLPVKDLAARMVGADTTSRSVSLPVVDGRLEGLVTTTDVLEAFATEDPRMANRPVEEAGDHDVCCVDVETPLPDAVRHMDSKHSYYALVLDDIDEISGILTHGDLLRAAQVVKGRIGTGASVAGGDDWDWTRINDQIEMLPAKNIELPVVPVSEFMIREPLTVSSETTLRKAALIMVGVMADFHVEQLPIVDGDEVEGIVENVDILEYLV